MSFADVSLSLPLTGGPSPRPALGPRLVLLAELPTEAEARLLGHALADAGIPSDVAGDPGVGLYGGFGFGARLTVPADRREEALRVWQEYDSMGGVAVREEERIDPAAPAVNRLSALATLAIIPLFFPIGLFAYPCLLLGSAKLEREWGPLPPDLRRRLRNARLLSAVALLPSVVILTIFLQ